MTVNIMKSEEIKMADIKPFQAYRPKKGMEQLIAALPYDVYNREEACEVVKANPESFLAIDRAETQFDESVDIYSAQVYVKARDIFYSVAEAIYVKRF